MKYDTRIWLERVVALKGTDPRRMMDLPRDMQMRSEIKPLHADGILIVVKKEWINGRSVPTWRISRQYLAAVEEKKIRSTAHTRYLFDQDNKSVFCTVRARCYQTSNDLHIEDALCVGDMILGDTYKVEGVLV